MLMTIYLNKAKVAVVKRDTDVLDAAEQAANREACVAAICDELRILGQVRLHLHSAEARRVERGVCH